NRLELYVETGNGATDTSSDVSITIAAGSTGDLLGDIGIVADVYAGPIVEHASHVDVPRWRTTD
ncbi:MAG: hypothetical protein GWN01_13385, partial [Nitrosopumilaceae archaeon]|nr:hypothetical protein [Nitrosopumilaceae archaeon]NIX62457.1 hypothetical protein [Nitrosopumilaceae archaeon]